MSSSSPAAASVISVGLAGLGLHGQRYAQHLIYGDVPGARLCAVHRRDHDAGLAWAATKNLRYCRTLEELVSSPDVDLVVAVLPPALHPRAIELAAEARKPILVEKPLAPDPSSASRACQAAAEAGILAMVAHTLRFNTVIRSLRALIPELGALSVVAINQRFEPINRTWLDQPEHGGLVLNTGIHGLDLLHFLTSARIVRASAQRRVPAGRRSEDTFTALLTLEPGAILATLDNTRTTSARSGRIEVCGEHGQLIADHVNGYLARVTGRGLQMLELPPPAATVRDALVAFVNAVQRGLPSPVPLEAGRAAVDAAALVREAWS